MEGKEGTRGERGRDTSVSPEGLKWKKRERERNGRMEEEGKRKGMERVLTAPNSLSASTNC